MYTFKKEERLCSKKLLEQLFSNGSSFLVYPFKINFLLNDAVSVPQVQVLVIVSKRRFKRAVDRNRIKRLIKEAYRLNKEAELFCHLPQKILLSINYIGKEIPEYDLVQKKLLKVFVKLVSTLSVVNEIG